MSACDANRVNRFESRARCFVSGTEEERLILLYGFLASTTKEVKRREKEEERGDD